MRHFLNRPHIGDRKTDGLYTYHQGMEYHADAMEMVFNSPFTDPVVLASGTGVEAGHLNAIQPPPLFVPRVTILTGIPTIAPSFTLQPLVGQDE